MRPVRLSVVVPIGLFLVGLVAAGVLGLRQYEANLTAMGAAVDAVADNAASELQRRMKLYEYGLRGTRGVVPRDGWANPRARQRFHEYALSREIDAEFHGARGFGYTQRVKPALEAKFLAEQREDGSREFTIRSLGKNDGERFVITYIEPLDRNSAALGLDIASESTRRDAALSAMASGQPTLSGPIELVQPDNLNDHSMLIMLPIYRGGATPPPDERDARTTGWVFAPLVTGEFLTGIADGSYSMELLDVTSPANIVVLHTSPELVKPAAPAFDRRRQLRMYGRHWELVIHPGKVLLARQNLTSPLTLAANTAAGGALLALLSMLMFSGRERRQRVFNRRARMAAIAESSHDAIIATDAQGRVTEWNAAAVQLFGYQAEQARGAALVELIVPFEQLRQDAQVLASTLAGEPTTMFETVRRHQDGHLIEVELSAAPIQRAKRGVAGVAMTIRDIRERNRIAREVRELNANLEQQVQLRTAQLEESSAMRRAVLANAGYGIIATDPDGAITLFNPAAEQMLGLPAKEAIGTEVERFHDPQEVALRAMQLEAELGTPVAAGFNALIARVGDTPDVGEWTYLAADGSRIPVLLTVSVLRRDDGQLLGYLGIAVDLTLRKAREAALTFSENKLRGLFELSPLGIVLIGADGVFVESNPAFQELVGYSEEDLRSLNHSTLTSPDYGRQEHGIMAALQGRGSYGPYEKHYIRKDGSRVPVRLNGMVLTIDDKRYLWAIVEDITTQRGAETAMISAVADAEAASRAKSDFLANMSHEIRTPMHAILGMLKLLQRTALDARQRDYAGKTEQAATTLLEILNDILDFSKIEAGHQMLESQEFELDPLMRNLATILSANVGDKDMEIVYDLDPTIPARLMGDSLRLQQVLINLAGNAVKFTQYGEVVVSARVESRDAQHVTLRFEIRDTGIGIAQDKLETIFEGFTQAEASTTRRFGGTGLGLAISRKLVRLMGGELGVESERGIGSRFHFSVDFEVVTGAHGHADAAPLPRPESQKALVVDDNESARESMREMLHSLGWQVDVADSGRKGLDAIEAARATGQTYGVVFLDWRMPGMDGWETSQQIRAGRDGASEPLIVMVTAHGRELLSERSAEETAALDGFLMKPVTVSMLLDAVAGVQASSTGATTVSVLPDSRRLDGMRILIVEDNPANQQVADELLSAEGAEVSIASGGTIALQLLAGEPTRYDAVLMDIQMPDMDGYTATRRIRAMHGFDRLPVIAMTANVQPSDREASFAAGMDDHVGKPFDLDDLVARLRHWTAVGPGESVQAAQTADAHSETQSVLNIDATLRRFAGNRKALDGNLDRFPNAARSVYQNLQSAHADDDRDGALHHLHTLYGLAAIAGAEQLASLARSPAGRKASEGDLAAVISAAGVAEIGTALDAVIAEITRMRPGTELGFTTASDHGPATTVAGPLPEEVKVALRELRELLAGSSLRALDAFASVRDVLARHDPAAVQSIDSALAELAFMPAMKRVDALLQENHQ